MLDPSIKDKEGLPLTCRAVFIVGQPPRSPLRRMPAAQVHLVRSHKLMAVIPRAQALTRS